jgi:hypothetical protein
MGYVTYGTEGGGGGGQNQNYFLKLIIINMCVLLYGNSLNIQGPAKKPDDF